jgi:hypothetical protein
MCFPRARVITGLLALSLMTSTMIGTALARGGRVGSRSATRGGRFSSQTANRIGHDNRRIGRPGFGPPRPGAWGPSGGGRDPRRPPRVGQSGMGRPRPQPTADGGFRPNAQEQTIPRNDPYKVNWKKPSNIYGGRGVNLPWYMTWHSGERFAAGSHKGRRRGLVNPPVNEQTIPHGTSQVNWKKQLSGGIVSISPNWPF